MKPVVREFVESPFQLFSAGKDRHKKNVPTSLERFGNGMVIDWYYYSFGSTAFPNSSSNASNITRHSAKKPSSLLLGFTLFKS